jgi:SNF2 family DNA or RNA helicase
MSFTSSIYWTGEYSARSRGQEYFDQEKVHCTHSDNSIYIAKVLGSREYTTTLQWCEHEYDTNLVASCNCASFLKNEEVCKHVWAILIDAGTSNLEEKHSEFKYPIIDLSTHLFESDDFPDKKIFFNPDLNTSVQLYQQYLENKCSDNTVPKWKQNLSHLERYIEQSKKYEDKELTIIPKLWYRIKLADTTAFNKSSEELSVDFYTHKKLKSGEEKFTKKMINSKRLDLHHESDQVILELLKPHFREVHYNKNSVERALIPTRHTQLFLNEMSQTKRLCVIHGESLKYLSTPIKFQANISKEDEHWILGGFLDTPNGQVSATVAHITSDFSFIVLGNSIHPINFGSLKNHCEYLINYGEIYVPLSEKAELKKILRNSLNIEQTKIHKSFDIKKEIVKPHAVVELIIDKSPEGIKVIPSVQFQYPEDTNIDDDIFLLRDQKYEDNIEKILHKHPIDENNLNQFVQTLNEHGIEVRAMGYKVKSNTNITRKVITGVDWFEVYGSVSFFGDDDYKLPDILRKSNISNHFIKLNDGTIGIIPQNWFDKTKKLLEFGEVSDNKIIFQKAQAIILDMFLDDYAVETDKEFKATLEGLKGFKTIKPVRESKKFNGELREYQRDGLNWMNFLKEYSLSGCLADDMGLGKTIQVLAHLQKLKNKLNTHLIVVPKSLIYNWQNEAKKFTPDLKIFVHEGTKRKEKMNSFADYDIVLMTYNIMRRDIAELKEFQFNTIILDEAQAIKNTKSQTTKAAYILRAHSRLALTGTPIENDLSDLFSIFRFLIPKLLPKAYANNTVKSNKNSMKVILRGLQPFILRRTKDEVLKELPDKVESVLYCEFSPTQRKIYDELQKHFQACLLNSQESNEAKEGSKFEVLSALLRLRQASCHPGLIDPAYNDIESSKLEVLIDSINELRDRGEKVLVFSQFTTFLKIVQRKLESEHITYSYLDGQTRNREKVVTEFKTDENISVFLISLKAGGVGLNLTEASYCFILDPWWNPAVEAQAIDRIHRIGQNKKVFAYRIITKGSVEEKVMKLQSKKSELTKDLMTSDGSFLQQLSKDDLSFLMT